MYIVRCEDGSLYTGITTDPRRRMQEHVKRLPACAKYTRSHQVCALCALWSAGTKGAALRLEARIKKLTPAKKRALIAAPASFAPIFEDTLDEADYHPEPLFPLAPLLAEKAQ